MLKIWSIPPPLGISDLVTPVSKILKFPKSIYRYPSIQIPKYFDTFRILVITSILFMTCQCTCQYLDTSVSQIFEYHKIQYLDPNSGPKLFCSKSLYFLEYLSNALTFFDYYFLIYFKQEIRIFEQFLTYLSNIPVFGNFGNGISNMGTCGAKQHHLTWTRMHHVKKSFNPDGGITLN